MGSLRGPGMLPPPTKLVTPGVLRTTNQRVGVEHHLDQHVAGEDLLLDGGTLAAADLDLVLHRDQDLEDLVLHAHRLDAVLEVGLDLVLVAGVRVDHVPALLGRSDLGALGSVSDVARLTLVRRGVRWPR